MNASNAAPRRDRAGRLLNVDLSQRQIDVLSVDPDVARRFIGSRGLNSWVLLNEMPLLADPLGADNVLVGRTGPLTGTAFPAAARYTISARSPLTGILGDANSGGFFGSELRAAGFDYAVVRGQADHPVVLWVKDGKAWLEDARDLWGLDTWQTTEVLQRRSGDGGVRVACIGQAGENMVRFACVVNDRHRAAGRAGLGAVMGSKRLKAIAVRGSGRVEVAHPTEFRETVRRLNEAVRNDKGFQARSTYGTAMLMPLISTAGMDMTRNGSLVYSKTTPPSVGGAGRSVLGDRVGCHACPIRLQPHL